VACLAKEIVEWWEEETGVLFKYASLRPPITNQNGFFERIDQGDGGQGIKSIWRKRMRSALIRRDFAFFRKFADALEFAQSEPLNITRLTAETFISLSLKEYIPTKHDLAKRVKYRWAFDRVLVRGGKEAVKGNLEGNAEIEREIKHFPKQNWTRILNRLGLKDLPRDPGGQPRQKRNARSVNR
jgi:hypothetical protein